MTVNAAENKKTKAKEKNNAGFAESFLIPILAVVTGLIIGGIVIIISNDTAIAAWQNFFHAPGTAIKASWDAITTGYGALFSGSLGKPTDMIAGFQQYTATGDRSEERRVGKECRL